MKQLFLTLITVLITASAWAQSPFQFNFQAVARNLAGNPLTNQSVDFRLSVLQGAMDGTAVYVEEQPATTNNFGLANLLVGSGTPALGSLSAVDWANGPYFLQIELDIQNGEGYQLMGTSALASVPYALHAKTSEQAGPEGPQGEPGEQGEAGPQGEPGEDGKGIFTTISNSDGSITFVYTDGSSYTTPSLVGPQGEQGMTGETGSVGPQGEQGVQGPQGPAGEQGDPGIQGASAYELWLEQGNVGTESDFLISLIGPQGVSIEAAEIVQDTLVLQFSNDTETTLPLPVAGSDIGNPQGIRIGFSESQSWTCPIDVTQITVEIWGGAGGGGSSSGWTYQIPGAKCYKFFSNNPGSGGYTGQGTDGAAGGSGGYIKTNLQVTPGLTYFINVGQGGAGGVGGCPYTVNQGTDGEDGHNSWIELDGVVLAEANGGFGGTKGSVPCGCPNVGGGGNSAFCDGWENGVSGDDGTVINFTQLMTAPELTSYIPSDYLTSMSNCCSLPGAGGSGVDCNIQSDSGNNYPKLEKGPESGAEGEQGFVVISY